MTITDLTTANDTPRPQRPTHLNVVADGRECVCGAFGCLEAEASGTAIAAITGAPARGAAPCSSASLPV